ncbi:MAG TPA: gamma-glutamyltransferase [Candidatus Krumholzibacteria bacterium]|nr:gamma-glutamyltransferase [Candidatus Krumholzibacteria bacterium]
MRYGFAIVTVWILAGVGAVHSHAADRPSGRGFSMRSPTIATHGMVASAHPLASRIGVEILEAGGTAVDAAIAVNAALGLMEPTACGVGGDLFAIVWDAKEKRLVGLNASGRAGSAITLAELRAKGLETMPQLGGLPVTVPGTVDGWFALHGRFGKLPMSKILAPAIRYAREGQPVPPIIAYYWSRAPQRFKDFPAWLQVYAPDGKAPSAGDVFRNPDLARTYERIAAGGRNAFYRGEISQRIVEAVTKHGGALTRQDLADHQSTWVEPLAATYRGYSLWELPPNTQGIAALQMLNMLEPYDLKAMGHNTAETLHLMVEVKKIVFEDRARYYADPDFVQMPLEQLLSKTYARQRSTLFDPARAKQSVAAGDLPLRAGDTTYFTVVDSERNIVSLIQSNYRGFGSGVVPEGTGFCLQDRGEMFSLDPAHPNAYEPRKRPFHTIVPAMVTHDGKPVFSFGVMGGDMQPQGHVQILCNIIDFGMDVQEAGDAARFYHTGSSEPTGEHMEDGGILHLESGVSAEVVRDLVLKGHRVVENVGGYGGYQGIWIDHERGVLLGATESRKDGIALGY